MDSCIPKEEEELPSCIWDLAVNRTWPVYYGYKQCLKIWKHLVNGNLGYPQKTLAVPLHVVVVLAVFFLSGLNLFKYFFIFYSGPYNTFFVWFKNFQQFVSKLLLRHLWCFCHVQWQSMKWPLYYVHLVSTFQPTLYNYTHALTINSQRNLLLKAIL